MFCSLQVWLRPAHLGFQSVKIFWLSNGVRLYNSLCISCKKVLSSRLSSLKRFSLPSPAILLFVLLPPNCIVSFAKSIISLNFVFLLIKSSNPSTVTFLINVLRLYVIQSVSARGFEMFHQVQLFVHHGDKLVLVRGAVFADVSRL